jgi:aryl-alcohol dehydrogenase-like predicted oxidoreductase
LPTIRELGIAFVAYSPLGRGFLTGAFKTIDDLPADDFRRNSPRFQGENFAKNLELVAKIKQLAVAKGCTPSQLALAWVLAQGPDIVPIPGTKRSKYLDENLAAAQIKFSSDELAQIDAILPSGSAAGERYAPGGMQNVNR